MKDFHQSIYVPVQVLPYKAPGISVIHFPVSVLIGSKRLIEEYTDKKTFYAVTAKDIIDIIDNENANNYVVLMSGDTGFYSGAKKLAEALAGKYEYSIINNIYYVFCCYCIKCLLICVFFYQPFRTNQHL